MKKDFGNIQEELKWASQHREAMGLVTVASEDYVACRCLLVHNLLSPGLVFGQQAIEKMIKAAIKFSNPKKSTKRIHELEKLQNIYEDVIKESLMPFSTVLKKLDKHYLSRYPDNKDGHIGKSSKELHEVDELFFFLFDRLSIPEVIKYRTKLFSYLFNTKLIEVTNSYEWLLLKNDSLKSRLKFFAQKNKEAFSLKYE